MLKSERPYGKIMLSGAPRFLKKREKERAGHKECKRTHRNPSGNKEAEKAGIRGASLHGLKSLGERGFESRLRNEDSMS